MTEALKLQLFEQKQKFLREIPHPKLILKELKILNRMEAELDPKQLSFDSVEMTSDVLNSSLENFLEKHIQATLELKQQISQSLTVKALFEVLARLYKSQVILLKKLQLYVPNFEDGYDNEVKMSQPIDTYIILKRIRELNLKEYEIKDYLCKEINAQEKPLAIILTNCLRANKILCHV